jgi:hypothetical protein
VVKIAVFKMECKNAARIAGVQAGKQMAHSVPVPDRRGKKK